MEGNSKKCRSPEEITESLKRGEMVTERELVFLRHQREMDARIAKLIYEAKLADPNSPESKKEQAAHDARLKEARASLKTGSGMMVSERERAEIKHEDGMDARMAEYYAAPAKQKAKSDPAVPISGIFHQSEPKTQQPLNPKGSINDDKTPSPTPRK
ncbi:MAG: hypothetical protein ACD_42C00027G0003 [uncultured bacterium]|nr:MAG: hypothetical protein ACD_42C00027G0003 [uncultured bacterium]OGT34563.1 MAG: hypothetical protein A3C44_06990 [Gammaproteobacteria bacterium RIFCSPHIGHO2_02_FULL_39_13]OGT49983.1 MAG: hypothetical protein A3E53_02095 [Gammaproteobacteria bacterium RIFCSPHIGHO2_12_FULL_39_24]